MIITDCFYVRVGILKSLGFALQTGLAQAISPGCTLCCSLWCLFHPTITSCALFCPSSVSFCSAVQDAQASLVASNWSISPFLSCVLLPSSRSSQFCLQCLGNNFCQYLSGKKWDSFYSVPGDSWTFRNDFYFFSWCFLKSAWESWKFPRGFQSKYIFCHKTMSNWAYDFVTVIPTNLNRRQTFSFAFSAVPNNIFDSLCLVMLLIFSMWFHWITCSWYNEN